MFALFVLALFVFALFVLALFVFALVVFMLTMRLFLALANPAFLTLTFATPMLFVFALAHPMLFTLALKTPVLFVLALSHHALFMFANTLTTFIVSMLIMSMIFVVAIFVVVIFVVVISPVDPPEHPGLAAKHFEQFTLATITLRSIELARGELLDHDDHPLMTLGGIRLGHATLKHSTIRSAFALRGNKGQSQTGGDEESGHVGDHDSV